MFCRVIKMQKEVISLGFLILCKPNHFPTTPNERVLGSKIVGRCMKYVNKTYDILRY
jgi:hypothetical protein